MGRTRSQAQHSQEQMLGADVTAPGKLSLLLGEHERALGVFAQLLERVSVHGVDSLRLAARDEHLFVELEAIKLEAWGMFSTCLLRQRGTGFAPPSWSQPRSRIAAGGRWLLGATSSWPRQPGAARRSRPSSGVSTGWRQSRCRPSLSAVASSMYRRRRPSPTPSTATC